MARCDSLRELDLEAPTVHALPDGWLRNCLRLEKLEIKHAQNLKALPATLLFGTKALTHLTLSWGALEALPAGLFNDSPNLHTVELNENYLETIPSGTFIVARRVRTLDLSSNELKGSAMEALAPLEDLTVLNLASNTHFSDVCEAGGYSPIRNSRNLTKLSLESTRVTRICRDWRQNMTFLGMLELGRTKVSSLSFEDLQFTRVVPSQVWLAGAPVIAVEMTREDFKNAASTPPSGARLYLNGRYKRVELACDCRMYWTRRTLEKHPRAFDAVDELRCIGGKLLRNVPPQDMVCARPEECAAAELPRACDCTVRPDDDPELDRQLVRVRCEHAALAYVPRPHSSPHSNSTERLYELLLADNNITDLHADDLNNIKGLDLRNNFLKTVDEETATRLGRIGGFLQLAGNLLKCDCNAAPLLRALHARAPSDTDLGVASCRDGSPLYRAPTATCPQRGLGAVPLVAWLAAALAVVLVLALACVACLASRERRFFLKAVLHRWGCVWRVIDREDEIERRYDAFVTFSHEDEAVVRELTARLEPTYHLCIHYRDWIPGRLIPEQIIESVRDSRRTIAFVSRHFLASSWARTEFREAHTAAMVDSRPRLIVVLLEEPADLLLDDLLQRYLKTNTYVRWGDPWFWDKLLVALPPPR